MRRHMIGVIALVLFGGAVVYWFRPPQGAFDQQLQAACWRLGAMMAVLWLAYPEAKRLPAWMWVTLPVLLVIVALRPRWLLVAIPIVIVLAILKPRLPSRR